MADEIAVVRIKADISGLKSGTADVVKELQKIDRQGKLTQDGMGKLDGATTRVKVSLKKMADETAGTKNALSGVEKATDTTNQTLKDLADSAAKTAGDMGKAAGGMSGLLQQFGQSGVVDTMATSMSNASGMVEGVSSMLSGLSSPIGLATIAIEGITTGLITYIEQAQQAEQKTATLVSNGFGEFYNGIENAESKLSLFDDTLFASTEKQNDLTKNMQEIQSSITTICQTATKERRDLTSSEIKELDNYFEKLRQLENEQLQIEAAKMGAVEEQAIIFSQTKTDSLEEYQKNAEEWIKTAQEQAQKQIELIEQQATSEMALRAQQRDAQTISQEEYQQYVQEILARRQEEIDSVNQHVGNVTSAFANGYAEQLGLGEWYRQEVAVGNLAYGYSNMSMESEQQRHTAEMERIKNAHYDNEFQRNNMLRYEEALHKENVSGIWKALTKDMSDEQINQLGVLMGLCAQTELYGGSLGTEAQSIADTVTGSFDGMSKKTRKSMEEAMSPLMEEMENAEPGLFAKAKALGKGIIRSIREAFDEHSPSRETRKIARFAIDGMELGFEDQENELYEKAKKIAKQTLKNIQQEFDINQNLYAKVKRTLSLQDVAQIMDRRTQKNNECDLIAQKLYDAIRLSPITIKPEIKNNFEVRPGDVLLDGELVGRRTAPTISRILAKGI